ncbi:hypothetical protein HD554DRAFT_1008927 [Boletus coccyginus]|nr:hypothetical protein HD554DRAFT_1008927 [Boletus coccyginus]
MHHALHIEEILLSVFSYCYTNEYRLRSHSGYLCRYANADLAALARTCKRFKEPALDMIWAELNDLVPLVRCLPEASWVESEGVHSLQKCLEQTDWDIILGYAQHVRALPRLRGLSGLSADCIEALSNPPSPIESISPHKPNAKITPLMRHLANSKLTRISFEDAGNLGATIDMFGERCPIVTAVRTDTAASLIRCWQNLCSVQCNDIGLDIEALSRLSRLHNLRYMDLEVHNVLVDQMHAAFSPAFTLTFPALEDLFLVSHHLTHIWRLLRHFRTPVAHDLDVSVDALPTAPDLMSFLVFLQEACTHASLNNLSLVAFNADETPLENAFSYYITFDHLRPLTVFQNIKSIMLNVPCGADLNEREFLRLASSWPHLEKFVVGEEHGRPESSAITPGGFLQLLERCRSLRVLYFQFDCRGYTEIPQGHPWRGFTMPKHSSIHLLLSPIEEESIEALGVFFHVAPHPDFSLTTHWDDRFSHDSERPQSGFCELYYDLWERARTLSRDLWKERRDLRHSLQT